MNAMSNYNEKKVEGAFTSLDYAFSRNLLVNEEQFTNTSEYEREDDWQGDTVNDVQSTLRAILPGLDMKLTDNPNGGNVMAIRIKKDMFDKLSNRLVPVFVRMLNIKDGHKKFKLVVTSYVRDPLIKSSHLSFRVLNTYKQDFIKKGIDSERMMIAIEKGNPAYLQFRFDKAF